MSIRISRFTDLYTVSVIEVGIVENACPAFGSKLPYYCILAANIFWEKPNEINLPGLAKND